MALVIGSVFYNLEDNTGSLYSRGALLFFGILMAAFQSALEVSFQRLKGLVTHLTVVPDFDFVCTKTHCGKASKICILSPLC